MKYTVILLVLIVSFSLVGCASKVDETQKERELYKQESLSQCSGLVVRDKCYHNVADYCDKMSNRSSRDFERDAQQREEYDMCMKINKPLFPTK